MDPVSEAPKKDLKSMSTPENPAKANVDGDELEDDTMLELGYVQAYRRVFRSVGNLCMVIALTS